MLPLKASHVIYWLDKLLHTVFKFLKYWFSMSNIFKLKAYQYPIFILIFEYTYLNK